MCELLSLRGVCKTYVAGGTRLEVLRDVSLDVGYGEIVAVVGARYEGKTTLTQIAAGIDRPDRGEVWFRGRDLCALSDGERERLLGRETTWVGLDGPSLPLTVRDYVGLPLAMGRRHGTREMRRLAHDALKRVGAADFERQLWQDTSRWQRVLVSLARGIVCRPALLVVDDVLDALGARRTLEAEALLRDAVDDLGCGLLMSVSDFEAALVAGRVWSFECGALRLMSDQLAGEADVVDIDGVRRSRHSRTMGH
jgi:ABC-type lipoprotein export system ATPase subunit